MMFKGKKGKQKWHIFGPFFQGKKGIGATQVFVFIVAAITFAVILLFGFKAINNFLDDAKQVEFIQFKLDLESTVNDIRTDFGAVDVKTFRAPTHFTKICFVDLGYTSTSTPPDKPDKVRSLCQENQIACTVWENTDSFIEGETNVFLSPPTEIRLNVAQIDLNPEGYLCEDIKKGKFTLILEGMGDRTKISKVPSSGP